MRRVLVAVSLGAACGLALTASSAARSPEGVAALAADPVRAAAPPPPCDVKHTWDGDFNDITVRRCTRRIQALTFRVREGLRLTQAGAAAVNRPGAETVECRQPRRYLIRCRIAPPLDRRAVFKVSFSVGDVPIHVRADAGRRIYGAWVKP